MESNTNEINVVSAEDEIPPEFQYLEQLIAFRLGNGRIPSFPEISIIGLCQ